MATIKDLHIDNVLGLLEAVAANSFDSVMISDARPNTPVIYVNKAFTKLTGYGEREVVGKSPAFLQGPATDKKVIARLRQRLQQKKPFEGKAINYKKDGTAFIMHWRVVPVKDARTNKVRYFIAIQREGSVS
jgi:PAS domain S-box-containing protein